MKEDDNVIECQVTETAVIDQELADVSVPLESTTISQQLIHEVLLELVDERVAQIEAAQSKIDEKKLEDEEIEEEAPVVVISHEFVDQLSEEEQDVELVVTPERKVAEHQSVSGSATGNGDIDDEDNYLSSLLIREQEQRE